MALHSQASKRNLVSTVIRFLPSTYSSFHTFQISVSNSANNTHKKITVFNASQGLEDVDKNTQKNPQKSHKKYISFNPLQGLYNSGHKTLKNPHKTLTQRRYSILSAMEGIEEISSDIPETPKVKPLRSNAHRSLKEVSNEIINPSINKKINSAAALQGLEEVSNVIIRIIECQENMMEWKLTVSRIPVTGLVVKKVMSSLKSPALSLRFMTWARSQPWFETTPPVYDDLINMAGYLKNIGLLRLLLVQRFRDWDENSPKAFMFLNAWHKCPDTLGEFLDVFDGLPIPAKKEVYDMAIAALCAEDNVDVALAVLEEMEAAPLHPNIKTFVPLVDAYCKVWGGPALEKIFTLMKEKKCSPSIECYNAAMKRFSQYDGNYNLVTTVFQDTAVEPVRTRRRANPETYDIMIHAACKYGRMEDSLMYLHDMRCKGMKPMHCTFGHIITAFFKSGEERCACELVKHCSGDDPFLDSSNYSLIAWHYIEMKRYLEAYRVLDLMKKRGLEFADSLSEELLTKIGYIKTLSSH